MPRNIAVHDEDVELILDALHAASSVRQRAATTAAAELFADPGIRDKRTGALRIASTLREAAVLSNYAGALLDAPTDAERNIAPPEPPAELVEPEGIPSSEAAGTQTITVQPEDVRPYDGPDLHLPALVDRVYSEGVTAEDDQPVDDAELAAADHG